MEHHNPKQSKLQQSENPLEEFINRADIPTEHRSEYYQLLQTIRQNTERQVRSDGLEFREDIWEAFLHNDRHHYTPTFYVPSQNGYTPESLHQQNFQKYFSLLYSDQPIPIHISEDRQDVVTISQPSFVLSILHLLNVNEGHFVYEAGLGSGWNAALMDSIVGQRGKVVASEIVEPVGNQAARILKLHDHTTVECIIGDANNGYGKGPIFDRILYAASSWVLPPALLADLSSTGRVILPLAVPGGMHLLLALDRDGDVLHSVSRPKPCGFVPLKGTGFDASHLECMFHGLPDSRLANTHEVDRVPRHPKTWQFDLRFFLGLLQMECLVIPGSAKADFNVGFYSEEKDSLSVIQHDRILQYGSDATLAPLKDAIELWNSLNQPSCTDFQLTVYPGESENKTQSRRWQVSRGNSTFVWALPSSQDSTTSASF